MRAGVRARRVMMRVTALAFYACSLEPTIPPITRIGVFACGNTDCTIIGAPLPGLPPKTGMFMVGAWFKGLHDVHWSIRWSTDSVKADFTGVRDSSIVGAKLDGMLFDVPLVLTVAMVAGGRDSLTWDLR